MEVAGRILCADQDWSQVESVDAESVSSVVHLFTSSKVVICQWLQHLFFGSNLAKQRGWVTSILAIFNILISRELIPSTNHASNITFFPTKNHWLMIGLCSRQVECSKELQCGTDMICPIICQGHSKWIEDIVISLKGHWIYKAWKPSSMQHSWRVAPF